MSDRWRGIVAALVNSDLRAALAELADAPLTGARRDRAFQRLSELGLVEPGGDDWVFSDAVLRAILIDSAPTKPTGAARFFAPDGRIDRYPQRDADRLAVLVEVSERALPRGAVWTESEVNELLEPFAPGGDVAVLRRYLVDAEILERTRSGSAYARVSESGD